MPWVDESRYPGEVDRLATLPLALDPAHMRPVLAGRAPEAFGARFAIDALDVDIYRRHGNRCVIRYCARGASAANGGVEWRVIGKVLPPGAGATLDANMRALWLHGFQRGAADGISVPEPIAYLPELSMHLQEDVGGVSVRNLVKQGLDERHFRLAARTLAKLHGCGLPAGLVRGVDAHMLRCHPRHPFLGLAFPELAAKVDDIVDRARALERRLPSLPVTPVHGDFHLGQVHVDGDRAWLVDLDALGFADPASDLGNLLVFLDDKIRRDPAMADMVQAFRDEYGKHAPFPVWDRVPLYEALTHLRRACKQLRLQQPGWREKVHAMVERSAREIAEAEALAGAHLNGGAA
ncbi:MAG TPA: phosphotransferase [Methylomirabilota bacterium]|jgi:aminoglycoside phosphotransferase (APT) family kinase protein|nr:phosphotransferase [Methylomirabilota bacterium]